MWHSLNQHARLLIKHTHGRWLASHTASLSLSRFAAVGQARCYNLKWVSISDRT